MMFTPFKLLEPKKRSKKSQGSACIARLTVKGGKKRGIEKIKGKKIKKKLHLIP